MKTYNVINFSDAYNFNFTRFINEFATMTATKGLNLTYMQKESILQIMYTMFDAGYLNLDTVFDRENLVEDDSLFEMLCNIVNEKYYDIPYLTDVQLAIVGGLVYANISTEPELQIFKEVLDGYRDWDTIAPYLAGVNEWAADIHKSEPYMIAQLEEFAMEWEHNKYGRIDEILEVDFDEFQEAEEENEN